MRFKGWPVRIPSLFGGRKAPLFVSIVLGLLFGGAALLWPAARALGGEEPNTAVLPDQLAASGHSFVFRFDPTLPLADAYSVFTIPTMSAAPDGLAVYEQAGTAEIWFAETGADKIGRLTYTDTADYSIQEYVLPAGSHPVNVAVDSVGQAWFTEYGRRRIGRISGSTGILHHFVISSADVGPLDLDIAPDGSVWFTEHNADRIGRLIVTSTADYAVDEFSVLPSYPVTPSWSDVGLSGILVKSDDTIWAALRNQERLARLRPSIPQVDRTGPITPTPAHPFELAMSPGGQRVWFTELQGNHISLVFRSTMEFGLRYSVPTANSRPYGIDVDSTGAVWFGEQLGGNIGRLAVTATASFTEFPVPLERARIQGLVVDSSDVVWCVADTWHRGHLPLAMRQ